MSRNSRIYKDVQLTNSRIGDRTSTGDNSIVINSEIGDYCEIDRRNYIHNSTIGCMTYTGWNTYIGMCDIGKFCSISRNVDMGGAEHNYHTASMLSEEKFFQLYTGEHPITDPTIRIEIGNDVWIGQGVTILKKRGIKIGDGAVIGCGAVVLHDVPPYAIAAGVPAKILKYRFERNIIDRLLELKWWDWPVEIIKENLCLLNTELNVKILDELSDIAEHGQSKSGEGRIEHEGNRRILWPGNTGEQ